MFRYKSRHEAVREQVYIIRKMICLITTLTVAVICYSVTVYAWFQSSIINTGNVIQSAKYEIIASVKNGDNEIKLTDGIFELSQGISYTVKLTARGEATKGYCIVSDGSENKFTGQIPVGTTMTFKLIPEENANYTFSGQWGIAQSTDIVEGAQIGKKDIDIKEIDVPIQAAEQQTAENQSEMTLNTYTDESEKDEKDTTSAIFETSDSSDNISSLDNENSAETAVSGCETIISDAVESGSNK